MFSTEVTIVQVLKSVKGRISSLKVTVFDTAILNHKISWKNNCLLTEDRKYKITSSSVMV